LKCCVCGFEENRGVKTANGFVCERDFSNPYLFVPARILSNFAQGKIRLDSFKNQFAKTEGQTGAAPLKNRTKNFLAMDEAVFAGQQKTLEVF
jgi:hypothetical protein